MRACRPGGLPSWMPYFLYLSSTFRVALHLQWKDLSREQHKKLIISIFAVEKNANSK
jgi:hypothetical protein